MKLNRGLFLASVLVVGSLAVTGCSKSGDEAAAPEAAGTEQASASDQGDGQEVAQADAKDEGTVEYARFGRGGRGGRGEHGRAVRGGRGFRGGHGFRAGRGLHGEHPWWRIW